MRMRITAAAVIALGLAACLTAAGPGDATAQTRVQDPAPERPAVAPEAPVASSLCYAFAERRRAPGAPRVMRARYAPDLAEDEVALTYIGHATFAIETPAGVTVATDYAGAAGALNPPMIVTMNGAHSSHNTDYPQAGIQHVLRGWRADGKPAGIDLTVRDLRLRSVSTNLRSGYGVDALNGNSIFVFEVGDLCIGHLGHLHHKPTPAMYGAIGFLDVVLAPVDGGYTMSVEDMIEVLQNLKARLVIPMHWFSTYGLERFATALGQDFEVRSHDGSTLRLTRRSLPKKPTVLLVPPTIASEFLSD